MFPASYLHLLQQLPGLIQKDESDSSFVAHVAHVLNNSLSIVPIGGKDDLYIISCSREWDPATWIRVDEMPLVET